LSPRNFHKSMYLYGAATSYIILPPKKYQLVAALGCRTCVDRVITVVTNHLRKMFRSHIHKSAERNTEAMNKSG